MSAWNDRTAYHEIGHCAVALSLGVRVYGLSIIPDTHEGRSRSGHAKLGSMWPKQEIVIDLAGAVAESLYVGGALPACELGAYRAWGAACDFESACECAAQINPAAAFDRRILGELLRKGQRKAIDILRQHWGIVVHLSWETQLAGRVSSEEFHRVARELLALRG